MYNVYHIFRDLRQFLLIVNLMPEVLPSNLQLYASSFLFTCRFYKVFCVRIGLVWIRILGHQLDWTGLGSVAHGFGLDWIVSTRPIPYADEGWAPKARSRSPTSDGKRAQVIFICFYVCMYVCFFSRISHDLEHLANPKWCHVVAP